MSKTLLNTILFIAGCVVLYVIANQLIASNKIKPYGEFIASSTVVVQNVGDKLFELPSTSVFTPKGSVKVFIASTTATREQGLSDVISLPSGEGVLFVFDISGKYGFWMKDMNFPLDLIWVDSDKNIVGVTKNALPSSYPFVFMPPRAISYVIEMNSGSVASYGFTTGTSIKFTLP